MRRQVNDTNSADRWRIATLALGTLVALGCFFIAAGASAATTHPNLSYDLDSPPADPSLNSLDLYMPDDAAAGDNRPVVVFVHGGGWRRGDKENKIENKISLFTGSGYVLASVNYRLSPLGGDPANPDPNRIKFPAHPHDVGEAIGWLDRNVARYGGDPTRMVVIGHSAGAQIISLVATDPSYIGAYGVEPWQLIGAVSLDTDAFDITSEGTQTGNIENRNLIWNAFGTPAENAASGAWVQASATTWASPEDPEFLLVTSANPNRLVDNQNMATALGQDPAGIFIAPYDHEGINEAVGSPTDTSGETQAVMGLISRAIAGSVDPKTKFEGKPKKKVRTKGKRARVRFRFTSPAAGATFKCKLDKGKFKPCKPGRKLKVKEGRHTFRVQAFSDRGRPGPVKKFKFRVVRK